MDEASVRTLLALLREDWEVHERDWSRPGLRAITLCRWGKLQRDSSHRSVRRLTRILHRVLYRWVRNHYGIELPWTVRLGRRVIIEHQGAIVVHGYCEIGDGCVIVQDVTLGNRYFERPLEAPTLGAGVRVGAGAKILGNVRVGDGARVGANAVVLDDVPPGATVAGVPATVVRDGPAVHAAAPPRS